LNAEKRQPGGRRGRRRWRWIAGVGLLLFGGWFLLTDVYREEEKELRSQLREAVKEAFPEEAATHSEGFGLAHFPSPAADEERGTVILVHGLDDPGLVWRSLAPALAREGFDVRLMEYPNDQPIAESAAFFFEELKTLRAEGREQVAIVAHSMGGLVTRDTLTRPATGFAAAAREGAVPQVTTFIMVGTPNHGSPLARLRGLAEVRDQIARLTRGKGSWLGVILDGAGEAKVDLLPGSRFLLELNRRPHPDGVEMLVIAGVAGPWSEDEIEDWVEEERQGASAGEAGSRAELGAGLRSLTRGLGDGLVSVESTQLEGVEHLTVEGTHLTMIRNLTEGSERIPPAVPLIVERLGAGGDE
jgi:hypothetical protein